MRNHIAIIGWGSLIWDLDDLAPKVEPPWSMGGGPALPLEFSRISPKRLMGLVVCIDPEAGTPCASHAIASVRETVAEARADLAVRERAPLDMIGAVCLREGTSEGRSAPLVCAWCEETGAAGAVWTDLRPNFRDHAGTAFDHGSAETWLTGLIGDSRDEAVRYIHNAPTSTDTPLRRWLAERDWWREDVARLAAAGAL